jgi:hypothetical protein
VLALYLFVVALAASPELHHLFNHGADDPDHQCAATVIAHGQVDAAPAAVVVIIPFSTCLQSPAVAPQPIAAADFWLPLERAPPVSSC